MRPADPTRSGLTPNQILAMQKKARRSVLSCRACTLKTEIWERPPQGRLRAAMSCAARLPIPPLLRVRACLAFHVRRTVARQIGTNVRRVPVPRAVVPITPWVHNKALLPRTGNPSPAWITDQKGGAATRSPAQISSSKRETNRMPTMVGIRSCAPWTMRRASDRARRYGGRRQIHDRPAAGEPAGAAVHRVRQETSPVLSQIPGATSCLGLRRELMGLCHGMQRGEP